MGKDTEVSHGEYIALHHDTGAVSPAVSGLGYGTCAERMALELTQPGLAEVLGLSIDELMQVKQAAEEKVDGKLAQDIVSLVFKTLCPATGVAVVVLSAATVF